MKLFLFLLLHSWRDLLAAILTILSSGAMLFGAVYGFMSPDLSAYRGFVGGLAFGASLCGFYASARLLKLGG